MGSQELSAFLFVQIQQVGIESPHQLPIASAVHAGNINQIQASFPFLQMQGGNNRLVAPVFPLHQFSQHHKGICPGCRFENRYRGVQMGWQLFHVFGTYGVAVLVIAVVPVQVASHRFFYGAAANPHFAIRHTYQLQYFRRRPQADIASRNFPRHDVIHRPCKGGICRFVKAGRGGMAHPLRSCALRRTVINGIHAVGIGTTVVASGVGQQSISNGLQI